MSVSYSIRIDFDSTQEHPERVFRAMALYIEGFNDLQEAFARGYCNDIHFESTLESTREGSFIADVVLKVRESTRRVNFDCILDAIYKGVKEEISITGKVDSEGDIRNFRGKVSATVAANAEYYDNFTCEGDAHLLDIADALNKIHKAKEKLSSSDLVQFGKDSDFVDINHNFSCPRNGEEIFKGAESFFPSKEILIVRRPSYVEGLQWDFERIKGRSKKINAKMLDKKWFSRLLEKKEELWPGDALYVSARTKKKINNNKNRTISYETEILEVIQVIPQVNIEQFSLDYGRD